MALRPLGVFLVLSSRTFGPKKALGEGIRNPPDPVMSLPVTPVGSDVLGAEVLFTLPCAGGIRDTTS